ncbi:MAG: hypothetical protein RR202_13235 [Bacteroidales bacterium]
MKLYAVSFVSKDGKDSYTPKHTYVGADKEKAIEEADKLRHQASLYPQYAHDYNVTILDPTGTMIYSHPFILTPEENKHDLERQAKWDKEQKRDAELKNEKAHLKEESMKDHKAEADKKSAEEKWSEK